MKTMLSALTAVGALFAFAPAALASGSPGVLRVEDRAGAFTPEGVKQAEKLFADTTFKSSTHFTVVTVTAKDAPGSLKADLQAAMEKHDAGTANRVFTDWARELAKSQHEKGVFVLAFLQGEQHWIKVVVDRQTDVARHFTDADAKKVSDLLVDGFKKAKGKPAEEARATRDVALLAATNDVIAELKNTSAPEPTHRTSTHSNDGHKSSGGGMSIGGWICLLLCVGLGIWLIVGLIRAFSGGGGYGYGGGGYGYGGGGFMSGFLGGMFGAAAGMWLYDSFTGGHHSSDLAANDASGGDTGDTGGAGDFDGGADAGGGDFGGDDGGGDYGGDAGGGDFGGGGGDFGGGDFGGGGGDFGGGDW